MINEVRNTVLSVLNKNNYGYLSPSDFNLFAKNAQMEIYEDYFNNYNDVINSENARMSGVDYADVEQPTAEAMESFLRTNYLSKISGNKFSAPSLTTTGSDFYYLLDVQCRPVTTKTGVNSAVSSNQLIDSLGFFNNFSIKSGDIVTNLTTGLISNVVSVLNPTTILLDSNIFLAAGNGYAIISSSTIVQAEKVINSKITLLENSNLTPPTNEYPVYTLKGNVIEMYPRTIMNKGQVQATYFTFPKPPKWTYIELTNGEPVFDQSQPDYQDFELPLEDEYKLVMKILQYAGISIREAEVAQYAMVQEQQQKQP